MKTMSLRTAWCAGAVMMAALGMASMASAQAKVAAKVATPIGDSAAGKALFAGRCAMCHGVEGKGGPMAPSLKGVFAGKAASQPGQKYSDALKASRLQWTAANLDTFLAKPQGLVRGTSMMAVTSKPEDRRNLIAYLATLKK